MLTKSPDSESWLSTGFAFDQNTLLWLGGQEEPRPKEPKETENDWRALSLFLA